MSNNQLIDSNEIGVYITGAASSRTPIQYKDVILPV